MGVFSSPLSPSPPSWQKSVTVPKYDAVTGSRWTPLPAVQVEHSVRKRCCTNMSAFTLANVTPSYSYRGRVSMMHSWSSDIVATIYMHAEVEAGEFGWAPGVLVKAASAGASLTPARRACCGVGLPFAGQWESGPVTSAPALVPRCLRSVLCSKAKVLCVVRRERESQFGSII